jgi:uncharacterized protein YecT (DUF1311 family)
VEPGRKRRVQETVRGPNWTLIALLGGLVLLVLLIAFLATRGDSDQDRLTKAEVASSTIASHEKLCASKATYDLIKRELFRRGSQLRGSDQAAYDELSAYAVVRMENPVMESENSSTGTVTCSGSLSLDLPPGVAVVGGRHTLMSDVDYTVQPAAGRNGSVVQLRNADALVTSLATLTRVSQPASATGVTETNEAAPEQPEANGVAPESASKASAPASAYPGRPSFDCARTRSRGEMSVCQDSGLSALDLNMATQYGRASASASPEQRDLLRQTDDRFRAYRDRCPTRQCIADAYVGRMREIRDIVEGRWQPPR